MSVKDEEWNEEQIEIEDISHIQEHRCLAMLALCFFFPLGYLAYRSSQKTRLYKEQKEYEKAKATSKFTFIYILSSITGGSIILFCLLFRLFYM
uniref:Transmembrane protein n=1 Tax=Rattus norvegicus TaxID=10116 RepID=A0ABK0M8X6_RAT